MSGKCATCETDLKDSPGGKYFKCLECNVSLCKYCYEQGTEPGTHMSSHDMRKIKMSKTEKSYGYPTSYSDDSDDSYDE